MRRALRAAALVLPLSLLALPAAAQQRIVSVDGAVTEIIHALGEQGRLIATDTSSTWPETVQALPKVGYKRALAAEGLLALGPDLILGTETAGPAPVLDRIRAAGIPVTTLREEASVDGVLAKVAGVADTLGVPDKGRALSDRIRGEIAAVTATIPADSTRPAVLFLMDTGRGGLMAAGTGTAADAVIALAGGRNAFAAAEGLKPLTPEAAVAARPDVIVLTAQAVARNGGVQAILAQPALAATSAAQAGRVAVVDTLLVLGFGPRIGEAVRQLAAVTHPGALPASQAKVPQAAATTP
ncbi:MAG: putative hemin-binding periplasmic protein HmuT precursor [Pseudomonadota bacterium]|jgi:iron complex transport system substrate-binding protein